jgi:ABC-2 type transport system permease protein
LLKPALGVTTNAEAYRIFIPGLLVMLAMFGSMFVGFGLIAELARRRDRAEPGHAGEPARADAWTVAARRRDALLPGATDHAAGDPVRAHGGLGDLLLAYLLLALIGLMLSALSNAIALKLRSEDALAPLDERRGPAIAASLGHPAAAGSGAVWLQRVADWNPFSWAVDASRALFAGDPTNSAVWKALVILGVLTALSLGWAARSFARSVR